MTLWIDIGPDASDKPYREAFVHIMRVMDPRYGALDEEQLASWLHFPCSVKGYLNDRLYAFGGILDSDDSQNAGRIGLVLLMRHIGAKPTSKDKATEPAAEFQMLGWPGYSADPDSLDATIDAILDKCKQWLSDIGLPDGPIRCFRPDRTEFGNARLLQDRICERATSVPPRGLKMLRRESMKDGEYWQLAPSN